MHRPCGWIANPATAGCVVALPAMGRTPLEEAGELVVADVIHERFTALPFDSTIAQVRDWFAESSHRRIAVLADHTRYVGSLTREDLGGDLDPLGRAADLASPVSTVTPEASAQTAYELALATAALRVPVVDHDGILIGVVGVTEDLAAFCGTG